MNAAASERTAYVNGRVVPESQATVSIYDRGFMSGVGIFERTRTFKGEPFRLDQHLDRLYRSLRMTHIDAGLSQAEMRTATLDLLAANRGLLGPNDDYSIGHYISKGPDGGTEPTVVIFCQPLPFKSFAREYLDGAHVVTPATRQVPNTVMDPKVKTTSRMFFAMAEYEAKMVDPKAYALILDQEGNVCEVSPGSNFWIVRNGTLVTAGGSSILLGVTRGAVLELAQALEIPVQEGAYQVYDVVNADEAFISTTSRCVLPVTKVNKMPIGDGKVGPIVSRLQNGWAEHFGHDFVRQALSHLEQPAAAAAG